MGLLWLSLLTLAHAADEDDGGLGDVITVVGDSAAEVEAVPGSAWVVTEEDLRRQRPMSGNEALQTVPGVTVQDEEGMGLRPNIGIRGLNPNRSRQLLVLEDGVPIALAPYGEPDLYYAPPIERMARLEVVKGSGSILFGPQTIGGVINYITPSIPDALQVRLEGRAGAYGYGQGFASVGERRGDVGYLVTAFHQRYHGPRSLDLVRTDVMGKLEARLDERQRLAAKLTLYQEGSAATYLGLTTPQFEADPQGSYAPHDRMAIHRIGLTLTHVALVAPEVRITTRAYGHLLQRNWRRQDFDRSDLGYDYERVIDGDGQDVTDDPTAWRADGSSIYFRPSNAIRERGFAVGGLESSVAGEWWAGPAHGTVLAGVRLHHEHTRERRVEGDLPESDSGELATDAVRKVSAVAAWGLHRFGFFDDRLQLSPGVRIEALWTNQLLLRWPVTVDGATVVQDQDPPLDNPQTLVGVLPGFGVSFRAAAPLTIFGGVHRGFSPPHVKDAVTTDGLPISLDAQWSWNTELGARVSRERWLWAEASGFWLDFRNQVIAPTESAGEVATTATNGGRTTHLGAELGARVDPLGAAGFTMGLPIQLDYTYVHAVFGEGWGAAVQGQRLPYAPEHQLTAGLGFEHPFGPAIMAWVRWTGPQFADRVETLDATTDGLVGRLDARTLVDLQASWTVDRLGLEAFVAVKNLLDEQYVASRAPRGIQPGAPRTVFVGLKWSFSPPRRARTEERG